MKIDEEKMLQVWEMTDEELDALCKTLTVEEKDETIKELINFCKKSWQLYLSVNKVTDNIMKMQDMARHHADIIIDDLLNRLSESKLKVYKKSDIMELLGCESDKALRFLKLAQQTGYAMKIGKEYQITRENVERFLKEYNGKDLFL